jgi:hypothetical protein
MNHSRLPTFLLLGSYPRGVAGPESTMGELKLAFPTIGESCAELRL